MARNVPTSITPELKAECRRLFEVEHKTLSAIARKFKLHFNTVSRWRNKENWTQVFQEPGPQELKPIVVTNGDGVGGEIVSEPSPNMGKDKGIAAKDIADLQRSDISDWLKITAKLKKQIRQQVKDAETPEDYRRLASTMKDISIAISKLYGDQRKIWGLDKDAPTTEAVNRINLEIYPSDE